MTTRRGKKEKNLLRSAALIGQKMAKKCAAQADGGKKKRGRG